MRKVVVERAHLVSYEPMTGHAIVEFRCGSGTYVRQLAADLGEALGCGAYCHDLRRTEVGALTVSAAIAPDEVVPGCGVDPLDVLGHIPRVDLDDHAAGEVRHGRRVPDPRGAGEGPVALASAGSLLAIAETGDGLLRPRVVLAG